MRWPPSCGLCGPGNRCEAWENGRHARAAQRGPGKSASATRTFAGSPVSCCAAFQRRSVTRLRRRQRQARLNRKPARGVQAQKARGRCQGWKHLDFYIRIKSRWGCLPEMEAFRFSNPGPGLEEGVVCTRVASNNIAVTDPAKLAQEFTQPHFYTPPAKKSSTCRSEATSKLQANRGYVTLQRRGCRSNSGLEILRRTRLFPERTSSAGSDFYV